MAFIWQSDCWKEGIAFITRLKIVMRIGLIIFRYLGTQILQVMAAVSLILLVVGLTSRFIQYLGQAVAGELASDVLLLLMLYRLPDFFLIIVPLSFFLGILLVYGRMYDENEMIVVVLP